VFSQSDEALLLTILGGAVLAAGLAQAVQVSGAVGALLAGILLSGPAAESARAMLTPLRDLFAAIFFAFVGLSVDPSTLPPALGTALLLSVLTVAGQLLAGWWAARRAGIGPRGRARTGVLLLARGEFSIAIAELAIAGGLITDLASVTIAYVLIMSIAGPVAAKLLEVPKLADLPVRLSRSAGTP